MPASVVSSDQSAMRDWFLYRDEIIGHYTTAYKVPICRREDIRYSEQAYWVCNLLYQIIFITYDFVIIITDF